MDNSKRNSIIKFLDQIVGDVSGSCIPSNSLSFHFDLGNITQLHIGTNLLLVQYQEAILVIPSSNNSMATFMPNYQSIKIITHEDRQKELPGSGRDILNAIIHDVRNNEWKIETLGNGSFYHYNAEDINNLPVEVSTLDEINANQGFGYTFISGVFRNLAMNA